VTYYWLYFSTFLLTTLSPIALRDRSRLVSWVILVGVSVLFIGLRHEIGGDWTNYFVLYLRVESEPFKFIYDAKDPGYVFVNWAASRLGWGIYGVNTVCAGIFVGGLAYFCSKQRLNGLSWLVATPYMLIVVGMGYTRQSVALGLFMVALVFLQDKRIWLYVFVLFVAATFHTSIVLFLPLAFLWLDGNIFRKLKGKFLRHRTISLAEVLGALVVICLMFGLALKNYDMFRSQINSYLFGDFWNSKGGMIRTLMNAGPGFCLIVFRKVWEQKIENGRIWYGISWLAILSVAGALINSTLTDRLGLYLLPLQLYFFSQVPMLFSDRTVRSCVVLLIALLYGTVLWVWLEYAEHAYYWVPYDNLLFR